MFIRYLPGLMFFSVCVCVCVSNERAHMRHVTRKSAFMFPTRSSTNQSVRPQKIARCLKPLIKEVAGMYYLCSKAKDADQPCGYHAADLRPCAFVFVYIVKKKQVF